MRSEQFVKKLKSEYSVMTETFSLNVVRNHRRALTLVELLVVIIILTTLVSAAIPLLAPTNDDRRLREASRGVNAFITGAQMKAIQLQRPVGVALKRLSQDTGSNDDNALSVELYYVEQPAPYRGFDRTSSAMVARHPSRPGFVLLQFVSRGVSATNDSLPAGWDADLIPPELIRPNDVIEIDGTRYALQSPLTAWSNVTVNNQTGMFIPPAAGTVVRIEARPLNDTGQMLNIEFDRDGYRIRDLPAGSSPNAPFWTNAVPYKVLRQPAPTSNEPFQLPDGTAIDLRASGQAVEIDEAAGEASGFFYNPDRPTAGDRVDNAATIIIMFTPEGSVERVRFNQENSTLPEPIEVYDERSLSNLFLLVGRRENAPPPPTSGAGHDSTLYAAEMVGKSDEQMQELKEPVNWLRSESRWIVIGSQSGRVVTVDNAFVDPRPLANQYPTPVDVLRARQIHAAREYGREMVQVGGR